MAENLKNEREINADAFEETIVQGDNEERTEEDVKQEALDSPSGSNNGFGKIQVTGRIEILEPYRRKDEKQMHLGGL